MARRRQRDRLYYREGRGWYGDFRDFADVGGKREAMIPTGRQNPTQDREGLAHADVVTPKDTVVVPVVIHAQADEEFEPLSLIPPELWLMRLKEQTP